MPLNYSGGLPPNISLLQNVIPYLDARYNGWSPGITVSPNGGPGGDGGDFGPNTVGTTTNGCYEANAFGVQLGGSLIYLLGGVTWASGVAISSLNTVITAGSSGGITGTNLPFVTVSPIGLSTSGVVLPNNGANYGPDTSGTTTSGIAEAVTSLSGKGGIVQLLSGTFNINSKITIPLNVQLIGANPGGFVSSSQYSATVLNDNLTSSDCITFQISGGQPGGQSIQNVTIVSNVLKTSGATIDMGSASYGLVIRGVFLNGNNFNGYDGIITGASPAQFYIENCQFSDYQDAGFLVNASGSGGNICYVTNCNFSPYTVNSSPYKGDAIRIESYPGGGLFLTGINATKWNNGLNITGTGQITALNVSSCTFDQMTTYGIYLPNTNNNFYQSQFQNVLVSFCGTGLYQGSNGAIDSIQFSNFIASACTQEGIKLTGHGGFTFVGGIVENSSNVIHNTYANINLQMNTNATVIMRGFYSAGSTPNYGLQIVENNNNQIEYDGYITTGGTGQVTITGSNTTNVYVRDSINIWNRDSIPIQLEVFSGNLIAVAGTFNTTGALSANTPNGALFLGSNIREVGGVNTSGVYGVATNINSTNIQPISLQTGLTTILNINPPIPNANGILLIPVSVESFGTNASGVLNVKYASVSGQYVTQIVNIPPTNTGIADTYPFLCPASTISGIIITGLGSANNVLKASATILGL